MLTNTSQPIGPSRFAVGFDTSRGVHGFSNPPDPNPIQSTRKIILWVIFSSMYPHGYAPVADQVHCRRRRWTLMPPHHMVLGHSADESDIFIPALAPRVGAKRGGQHAPQLHIQNQLHCRQTTNQPHVQGLTKIIMVTH